MRAVFAALFASCSAGSTRDEVQSLPGYNKTLPTRHYSGFVEVEPKTSSHLFYYYVESQNDPENDPVIWWMNGGPGASSLVGLFAEVGPLLYTEENTLIENPFAWNKKANLLFVEFAEGVGFSYCENSTKGSATCQQSDGTCSPCPSGDNQAAAHNAAFYTKLLTESSLFPELKGRPLYLAGESYAGVYVPTLAAALLDGQKDTSIVNLHGLWVTDPCTDNKLQGGWLDIGVDFDYQKGLLSTPLFQTLKSADCVASRTKVGDAVRGLATPACRSAWRQYDLATAGIGDAVQPAEIPGLPMYIDPLSIYGPSGGADLPGYIGSAAVRKAIHATQSPNKVYHLELFNNGYIGFTHNYAACALEIDYKGPGAIPSMIDVYHGLIEARKAGGSAANLGVIVVSSGDTDPVVAMHGTEAAVAGLKLPLTQGSGGARRPWFYDARAVPIELLAAKPVQFGNGLFAKDAGVQLGGFVTSYDTGVSASRGFENDMLFEFVTVHSSGHMVPQYAPQRAHHILDRLLLGIDPATTTTAISGTKILSPLLPSGWDTAPASKFYDLEGKMGKQGGLFAQWVVEAMGSNYTDAK